MNRISMKLLLAGKNHLASTSGTISLTTFGTCLLITE